MPDTSNPLQMPQPAPPQPRDAFDVARGAAQPAINAICHGHKDTERHDLTRPQAEILLQWFSGENWHGGPRCLLDILRFIEEENSPVPPLAEHEPYS
jgi:hypothetical protein